MIQRRCMIQRRRDYPSVLLREGVVDMAESRLLHLFPPRVASADLPCFKDVTDNNDAHFATFCCPLLPSCRGPDILSPLHQQQLDSCEEKEERKSSNNQYKMPQSYDFTVGDLIALIKGHFLPSISINTSPPSRSST
jgi:hypothetical protein